MPQGRKNKTCWALSLQVQASTVSRISYSYSVLPWHFASCLRSRDKGIGQTTPFVQPCVAALLAFPMSGIGPESKSIRVFSTEYIPAPVPFTWELVSTLFQRHVLHAKGSGRPEWMTA